MTATAHDALSSQKDKRNVACCVPEAEVMSNMEPMEINGCKVFMHFAKDYKPEVRVDIANLLIETFLKRRDAE